MDGKRALRLRGISWRLRLKPKLWEYMLNIFFLVSQIRYRAITTHSQCLRNDQWRAEAGSGGRGKQKMLDVLSVNTYANRT